MLWTEKKIWLFDREESTWYQSPLWHQSQLIFLIINNNGSQLQKSEDENIIKTDLESRGTEDTEELKETSLRKMNLATWLAGEMSHSKERLKETPLHWSSDESPRLQTILQSHL